MDERDQKSVAEQILDRILSDDQFRRELLENPVETLDKAGFNMAMRGGDDVSGYKLTLALDNPLAATTAVGCGQIPPPPPVGTTAMGCGHHPIPATTGIGCGEKDPIPPPSTRISQ